MAANVNDVVVSSQASAAAANSTRHACNRYRTIFVIASSPRIGMREAEIVVYVSAPLRYWVRCKFAKRVSNAGKIL